MGKADSVGKTDHPRFVPGPGTSLDLLPAVAWRLRTVDGAGRKKGRKPSPLRTPGRRGDDAAAMTARACYGASLSSRVGQGLSGVCSIIISALVSRTEVSIRSQFKLRSPADEGTGMSIAGSGVGASVAAKLRGPCGVCWNSGGSRAKPARLLFGKSVGCFSVGNTRLLLPWDKYTTIGRR